MTEPTATWKGRPLYQCDKCPFNTLKQAQFEAHVRIEHAPPKPNVLRPLTAERDETTTVEEAEEEEHDDATSNPGAAEKGNKQPTRRRAAH